LQVDGAAIEGRGGDKVASWDSACEKSKQVGKQWRPPCRCFVCLQYYFWLAHQLVQVRLPREEAKEMPLQKSSDVYVVLNVCHLFSTVVAYNRLRMGVKALLRVGKLAVVASIGPEISISEKLIA
jgi:hypothetical protein